MNYRNLTNSIVTTSATKIILTIPTINPTDNPFFEGDGPGDDG